MSNFLNQYTWGIFFLLGITSSLHCVGMCGGLVLASTSKNIDLLTYQVGRLFGYLFLGLVGGALGKLLTLESHFKSLNLLAGIFLGSFFLYKGMNTLYPKFAPAHNSRLASYAYTLYKKIQNNFLLKLLPTPMSTGLLSLLLPCGVLYSMALATATLNSIKDGLLAVIFFWIGTLPAVTLAPKVVRTIMNPIKLKLPKVYALSFILIGILTIAIRIDKFQSQQNNLINNSGPTCH